MADQQNKDFMAGLFWSSDDPVTEAFMRQLQVESRDDRIERKIDELGQDIRALYNILSGLMLRLDLKDLDIDPGEVFLPGLRVGRKERQSSKKRFPETVTLTEHILQFSVGEE